MILNFNYKFNLYQYQLLFLLQITLKATAFSLSEKILPQELHPYCGSL